jgi:CheY-like chemotaxis protein
MNSDFRILFADDEETFLYSTSELLRRARRRSAVPSCRPL